MLQRMRTFSTIGWIGATTWSRFVSVFMTSFVGGLAAVYLFVLLVDPYGVVAFSLPIDRKIVSINQRYMFPQIVRSRHFDSLIVGTSTARLLDPEILNGPFGARFANLTMDAMTAWEQQTVVSFFVREAGAPKVLIVGLDFAWCDGQADRNRVTVRGFPDWLYDDNRWNDYLYLLNTSTVEFAVRLVALQLGLYPERIRSDGFVLFSRADDRYDLARARQIIWNGRTPSVPPDVPPPILSEHERQTLSFPALTWLDDMLAKVPATTTKVLAFMPVHVAAQPWPGTKEAAVEAECKARIAAVARQHAATVIDWRIASPITTVDANYWDRLHYRVPIGRQIARELISATIEGRQSDDHSYRVVTR